LDLLPDFALDFVLDLALDGVFALDATLDFAFDVDFAICAPRIGHRATLPGDTTMIPAHGTASRCRTASSVTGIRRQTGPRRHQSRMPGYHSACPLSPSGDMLQLAPSKD
jgi:hypothetical protein